MRVIALVQARMGSRRFPQKMMAKLGRRTILEWVLARVSMSKKLADVVLTTTNLPEDNVLVRLARKMKIKVFRGSKEDVAERFFAAAKKFSADVIVRICADNPFVDPKEIDRLIEKYSKNPCDYLCNHRNLMGSRYPDGFGAEIFPIASLKMILSQTKKKIFREHVTLYLLKNINSFNIKSLKAPRTLSYPNYRFDIDTKKDLQNMNILVKQGVSLKTPAKKITHIKNLISQKKKVE